MTQKHFRALAWELADCRPSREQEPKEFATWWACVQRVAGVAKEANTRFDSDRFFDACLGAPSIKDGMRHLVSVNGRRFSV